MTYRRPTLRKYIPPSRSGNLYYVRLKTNHGTFYKIGFTTLASVQERLGYNGRGDEVLIEKILLFVWMDNAFDIEEELHSLSRQWAAYSFHTTDPNGPLFKNGQTELYRWDVLGMDPEGPSLPDPSQPKKPSSIFKETLTLFLGGVVSLIFGRRTDSVTPATPSLQRQERLQVIHMKIREARAMFLIKIEKELERLEQQVKIDSPGRPLVEMLKRQSNEKVNEFLAVRVRFDDQLLASVDSKYIPWRALSDSNSVRWSPDLISKYEGRWDWSLLSCNESLCWSVELLLRFAQRWNWHSISENKALPWTNELILLFVQYWDWGSLSENTGIRWNEVLLDEHRDKWCWTLLSMNETLPFTISLLEKFKERAPLKTPVLP